MWLRLYKSFGKLTERGPEDGPKVMVIPGFVANDRTTLGLQRALAAAGYRVAGWGMGLNKGVRPDTLERLAARIEAFGKGEKVVLVGWSLGGVFARELAKLRPDLVDKVVTMGSPFSGDMRANNVWRLYEWIAGHPVDKPPIEADLPLKPRCRPWPCGRARTASSRSARPAAFRKERPPSGAGLQPHGFGVSGGLSRDHRAIRAF